MNWRALRLFGCSLALFVASASIAVAQGKNDLRLRLESFNINLDPAFISDTQSRRLVDMLHAKLVSSNKKNQFFPELADGWSWTSSMSLRVRLKRDLHFSNGTKITAADVVYSLCRLIQPGAPYGWLFSNIKRDVDTVGNKVSCTGLRASDEYTVDIAVSSDPERLLPALASSTAAIVPADAKAAEYGNLAGAGPYTVEQILPGSKVVLKANPGGPLEPKAQRVTFQLVQDDAAAATLFRNGQLDAIEVTNPTLQGLLFDANERPIVKGARAVQSDVHQVRVLIFNETSIARDARLSVEQVHDWVRAYTAQIDSENLARRFSPLAVPIRTSYFPARVAAQRESYFGPTVTGRGRLEIISENDPYSDAIAAALPGSFGGVDVGRVGLEKGVLVSRLLKREFDVASVTLEAMLAYKAYWLAFFEPGSPFTVFGMPLQGLIPSGSGDPSADVQNAQTIDQKGNWFILFQERHTLLLQPWTIGETFLATGLVNYATMGTTR